MGGMLAGALAFLIARAGRASLRIMWQLIKGGKRKAMDSAIEIARELVARAESDLGPGQGDAKYDLVWAWLVARCAKEALVLAHWEMNLAIELAVGELNDAVTEALTT